MFRCNRSIIAAVAIAMPGAFTGLADAMEKPAAACAAPVAPEIELAPWTSPVSLGAAKNAAAMADARLAIGQAAVLTLSPAAQVEFPTAPGKPGEADSFGGMVEIDVEQPGVYRIALASPAWVDVVAADGRAIASTSHSHGAACTDIRKIVEFPLRPGSHIVLIAGNATTRTTLLVARRP